MPEVILTVRSAERPNWGRKETGGFRLGIGKHLTFRWRRTGTGSDFDLAYFVGPSDVWGFFGVGSENRLGTIEAWLAAKAAESAPYKAIYDDPDLRQKFIRYYGLRGSAIYSKGAHDEWNIVVALNAKRAIGDDIATYFDGKPAEPGDYQDTVEAGYQTILH